LCSSSRTTRQCMINKIVLKYLNNDLRRPFENCELTPLFYRITQDTMCQLNCICSLSDAP